MFQSEDLTQQTDLVKPLPYGILASPQRRKPITLSGGSPQLKGSFLHRAVTVEKAVENSSLKMVKIKVVPMIDMLMYVESKMELVKHASLFWLH